MSFFTKRHWAMMALTLLMAFLVACGGTTATTPEPQATAAATEASSGEEPTAAPENPAGEGKIAFLLPETKTARYETQDLPNFKAKLAELGFDVENNLIYSNANQDASVQLQQAEAALANGATVLVLDPVDSDAAAVIADMAKAQNVPVIAYDRLIKGSDGVNYYISFDNEKVGQLQAESLLKALEGIENPTIVMINGSPTDNNAALFKQGAHSVLDGAVEIAKEYDTPDWSPDKAQEQMTQALTALGNEVDGVYAANDGTGGGAIAAMKAAGIDPLPPVTGQDAELAAIQRIIVGEQYMTVYKAIKPEAEMAAEVAFALYNGQEPDASLVNGAVPNGVMDVPSILLAPIAVTKDNVKDTVIADGFWSVEDVCTSEYAEACAAAGLTGEASSDTLPEVSVPADAKIAFLLPETKTARYETQDLPNFKAKLAELGFDVENNLIYSNANQDASVQLQQAEAALANGAKVLVLDPVDSDAAAVIADMAKAQNVPVIAYDRLIKGSDGVDYYISFDNEKVGQLQAESLLEALAGVDAASIVMINGSPTDNNAALFKKGAHAILDGAVEIAKEYDTPDWSPDKAQEQMTQALTALGNEVDGVYAANDGTAGGAIAAMKAAGIDPLPPVTGQDAELAAIQRIIVGEQYMTVYKAIKPEAEAAAQLAFLLLTGAEVPAEWVNGAVDNGVMEVPSILLTPIAVTLENVKETVIADGFWSVEDICTSEYAEACKAAGIE